MYFRASVTPDSKHETVVRLKPDHFVVHVREPAKHNLANERVYEIIARELGVERKRVRIINGHHSSSKLISVAD